MQCSRCKLLVKSELEKLDLYNINIKEGEVEIKETLPDEKLQRLTLALHDLQLELTDDRDSILIEKIKNAMNEISYNSVDWVNINFSDHLSSQLGYTYKYLSNKFLKVMGISVKRYFIKQQIEHVKEMLIHEDLSLSQIAFKMHYSSVAHLSTQFKKETGLTPSQFSHLSYKTKTLTTNQ